jgi:hypothetical protein
MKLDVSNGTCLSHDDPDIWFAGEVDLADTNSSVNTNSLEARKQVENAITALSICKNCPAKDNCLEIGKSDDSLYFGIYGGTMPGERLAMVGRVTRNSGIMQKVRFASKVRSTMLERGIQWS